MATFDYAGLANIVPGLLTEFGQTVTLRRPGALTSGSDPVPGGATDYTLTGVIESTEDDTDEARGRTTARKLLLAGTGIAPLVADLVAVGMSAAEADAQESAGTRAWAPVATVETVSPGGTVLYYRLEVAA